jgi:hypothetical protein
MNEAKAKLQKIRPLLEKLEQEIKACRAILKGESSNNE